MRIPIRFACPSFSPLRWLQLHWPEQQQFAEGSGNFRSLQSPSGTDPPCHQSPSVHAEMWVWQQHLQRLCAPCLSQTCRPGKLALRMLLWQVIHGLMLPWAHSPLSWHPQKLWLAVTSQQTVKTKQHTENVSTWLCNLREDGEKTILKYVFQFIVSKQTQLVGLPSDRQIFVTLLLFYSVSSRHLSIVGMQEGEKKNHVLNLRWGNKLQPGANCPETWSFAICYCCNGTTQLYCTGVCFTIS